MNLDFRDAIKKQGKKAIEDKYGNLFEMYTAITGINPYEEPDDIQILPVTIQWADCGSIMSS